MIRLEDCDDVIDHTARSFSALINTSNLTIQNPQMKPQLTFAEVAKIGLAASKPDPFAKIAKAISGGMAGKIAPKSSDMLGMVTKKQYRVPRGTTITIPRANATLPIDHHDVGAGQMITSKKEVVYTESDLLFNDDGYYGFRVPFNKREIPYILVDHKRTKVMYIIELPGDLNEEIF